MDKQGDSQFGRAGWGKQRRQYAAAGLCSVGGAGDSAKPYNADDKMAADGRKLPGEQKRLSGQKSPTEQKRPDGRKPSGEQKRPDGRKALGKRGEDIAAAWLEARGLCIVERNYRCRMGEIDIVCRAGNTTVIVEVRGRSSTQWGSPAESVDYRKRQRLRKLAAHYLYQKGKNDGVCRFDVVSILFDREGNPEKIEWLPDAFR